DDLEDVEPVPAQKPRFVALAAGADDEADHAAAVMAGRLLRRAGFATEVLSSGSLVGQIVSVAKERGARGFLLSNVPPAGFVQIRYACKRLAELDGLEVIVGVWGAEADAERGRDRLPQRGPFRVVRTLADALAEARRVLGALQIESHSERSSNVPVRP